MCAVSGVFVSYPHPDGQGLAEPWSSTVYLGWFKLIMYTKRFLCTDDT